MKWMFLFQVYQTRNVTGECINILVIKFSFFLANVCKILRSCSMQLSSSLFAFYKLIRLVSYIIYFAQRNILNFQKLRESLVFGIICCCYCVKILEYLCDKFLLQNEKKSMRPFSLCFLYGYDLGWIFIKTLTHVKASIYSHFFTSYGLSQIVLRYQVMSNQMYIASF